MTDAPETIYLQWIPEGNPYDDEITWCEDEIHEDDIEYTRKDIADKRIAEMEAENERLRRNNQTFANNAILAEDIEALKEI